MGTLTNYNDLAAWFNSNYQSGGTPASGSDAAEGKFLPYWTLYSSAAGQKDAILAVNRTISNQSDSLKHLTDSIKRLNNPQGVTFRIFQTSKPAHNSGYEANVQIYEAATNAVVQNNALSGIGSIPQGYISALEVNEKIEAALEKQSLMYRLEQLEQAEPPKEIVDRLIEGLERVSKTPIGQAIIAKISGVPPEVMAMMAQSMDNAAVTGTPASDDGFDENLERTCNMLKVSDDVLMARLRALVEQNPEMAKSLILGNG